jgi:hypothetical protein
VAIQTLPPNLSISFRNACEGKPLVNQRTVDLEREDVGSRTGW